MFESPRPFVLVDVMQKSLPDDDGPNGMMNEDMGLMHEKPTDVILGFCVCIYIYTGWWF